MNPGIGPDSYKGYYAGISAEAGEVTLGKADGHWTPLGAARRAFTADAPYRMRVEARGSRLRVFVESMVTPVLEVTDSTHAAGAVGVRHYTAHSEQAHAAFSKVAVTAA